MIKALGFNPLNDEMQAREILTDFKLVDDFWINTDKGPLLAGEVWRDTEANRELIQKIIYQKKDRKRILDEIGQNIYKLLNLKEK